MSKSSKTKESKSKKDSALIAELKAKQLAPNDSASQANSAAESASTGGPLSQLSPQASSRSSNDFLLSILKVGTAVEEESALLLKSIDNLDQIRAQLEKMLTQTKDNTDEQGSLLVVFSDMKNALAQLVGDINQEIAAVDGNLKQILGNLEVLEPKEVKEAKYKLQQAQKELGSFLNKFIHDIAFIADEENLNSACNVVKFKFAEKQVNLSLEYELVFRSYISLYLSFDCWWKKYDISNLAKFEINQLADAMSNLDQQILLLQKLIPIMPDAETAILSWKNQSKEKNSVFTGLMFTHPDTKEPMMDIMNYYAAPRQFLIRAENLLTAIAKYLPDNHQHLPVLRSAEQFLKKGNDGVNRSLKSMDNAKMLSLLQNSKLFKSITLNEQSHPRDLLDTSPLKNLWIQGSDGKAFDEILFEDPNIPSSLFLFRNTVVTSDPNVYLIAAAIYKEKEKSRQLHTIEFPNIWIEDVPEDIAASLQIKDASAAALIVSPTTKWIAKFVSSDALALWKAIIDSLIKRTLNFDLLRANKEHYKDVAFPKTETQFNGGWRFVPKIGLAYPCSVGTCTITKGKDVHVYDGSWDYFAEQNEGQGFGTISVNGVRELKKSWKFTMDLVQGPVITHLEHTPIQDKIVQLEKITDEDWDIILKVTLSTEHIGARGEELFKAGEFVDNLYLLKSGGVKIMKGDSVISQNGPGFLLGTNSLFTGDSKSETTCVFTENSMCMVISKAALAPLINNWPLQSFKLIKFISHQAFTVEMINYNRKRTEGSLSSARSIRRNNITPNVASVRSIKDNGIAHADTPCRLKKLLGTLSIHSEVLSFVEATKGIGLIQPEKKHLRYELIGDIVYDEATYKLTVIYKKKPTAKKVYPFILGSKNPHEFANMAKIFWNSVLKRTGTTAQKATSLVPKGVVQNAESTSTGISCEDAELFRELGGHVVFPNRKKDVDQIIFALAESHAKVVELKVGEVLAEWGANANVLFLSNGSVELTGFVPEPKQIDKTGESNIIMGHNVFFSEPVNNFKLTALEPSSIQIIPLSFFFLCMVKYEWFPVEWYRQLIVFSTEAIRQEVNQPKAFKYVNKFKLTT